MKQKKINILMAINRNYLQQMKTVICSLGSNCSCAVDIYIMHQELKAADISMLQNLTKKMCDGTVYEIKMNSEFLKGAKILSHFSIEMYYRIFASEFLPTNLDRILWLDADLVVLKDLKEFYFTDFNGMSVAVCGHRERVLSEPVMNKIGIERLGLKKGDVYFNSGVLLMNLNKIRNNFNKEEVLKLIYEKEELLVNPDQDILNLLYQDDKFVLDWKKYNYQAHFDWDYPNEKQWLDESVAIVHYVGPFKPWVYTSSHFSYKYYWKYYFMHGSKFSYVKNEVVKFIFLLYIKLKRKGEKK